MQAFRAGCMLSATVMLGVSVEHTFELLLEQLEAHASHKTTLAPAFAERTLLRKFNKFRAVLDSNTKALPPEVKEDLDTHFAGILSVIRTYRNESGHPTGKIIDREQTFVLLQLFIPYCKEAVPTHAALRAIKERCGGECIYPSRNWANGSVRWSVGASTTTRCEPTLRVWRRSGTM